MSQLAYARGNPYKTMVWIILMGSSVLFVFTTGLFINRWQQEGEISFPLPHVFYFSTLLVLLASFVLHLARKAHAAEKFKQYKVLLYTALGIGGGFLVSQLVGWWQLYQSGIKLTSSATAAFIYVLSGLHFVHIVGAMIALFITTLDAKNARTYAEGYLLGHHPTKRTRMQLIGTVWHFLDALWVGLFLLFVFRLS